MIDPLAFIAWLDRTQVPAIETQNAWRRAVETRWLRIAAARRYPRDLVEEAAAEAWIKVFERIGDLRDPERLQAWTDQIFVRCMLDQIATQWRERPTDVFDDRETPYWSQRRGAADDELAARERLAIVRRAVAQLSEIQKRVFKLRFEEQLRVREIAQCVGRSESRVRHIIEQIRVVIGAAVVER